MQGRTVFSKPVHALLALALTLSLLGFNLLTMMGSTAQAQASKTVNVELILDASGSMAEEIAPGQTRIDAAKDVLTEVVASLPEREGINLGFRVYDHKKNNTEAGKAESCKSTELRVPIDGVNKPALQAVVDA